MELKDILNSGEMYNDLSEDCIKARNYATKLTKEYNESTDQEERKNILNKLLNKCGKNSHFEPNFRCEYGFNISIGDNFFANFDCIILDCAPVNIGNNVLFGPRVGIYCANHAIDPIERQNGGCYSKAVNIGNNVWIGAGVHIVQGVNIGDNSVVGAGSVVLSDIPPNVVAAGNPCRVIREITENDKTGYIKL